MRAHIWIRRRDEHALDKHYELRRVTLMFAANGSIQPVRGELVQYGYPDTRQKMVAKFTSVASKVTVFIVMYKHCSCGANKSKVTATTIIGTCELHRSHEIKRRRQLPTNQPTLTQLWRHQNANRQVNLSTNHIQQSSRRRNVPANQQTLTQMWK